MGKRYRKNVAEQLKLLDDHVHYVVKKLIWYNNENGRLIRKYNMVKGGALPEDVAFNYAEMAKHAKDLACVKNQVYQIWPDLELTMEKLLNDASFEVTKKAEVFTHLREIKDKQSKAGKL